MPRVYCVTGTRSDLSGRDIGLIRLVWTAEGLVDHQPLDQLHHGDCPTGVDRYIADLAERHRYLVTPYPADWDKHGKAAGPIRNREMLDAAKPNRLYAFPRKGLPNKGTKDCVEAAWERGIDTLVVWLSEADDA